MKKLTLLVLCCISLSISYAQMGNLPPTYFPNYTHLCDNSPWKLVFADNFDGNQIDATKWITYGSWQDMPGGDNEHWKNARAGDEHSFIWRDYNVVVNGGTVKLLMRKETGSWQCTGCGNASTLYRRHFSAGQIGTKRNVNGLNVSYNTGAMEARIRFPIFRGAWCAFWAYEGSGINEIDMAEAWGGPLKLIASDQRRNKYATHAWWYDQANNPNNMPYDAARSNYWPNQGWWNLTFNRSSFHDQSNWHIYTTEWDDNVIKFYLNHALISTQWKWVYVTNPVEPYGIPIGVGSPCEPVSTVPYHISYGYPYNTHSSSQILLWGRVDDQIKLTPIEKVVDSVLFPELLGGMEVDYVRVWQRHPEADNHKDICDLGQPKPKIQGPDWVCNTTTFTVSNPVPYGTFIGWGYSYHFSQSGSSTNSSITLTRNGQDPYTDGFISYKYQVPGCPIQETVYKQVGCTLVPWRGSQYEVFSVRTTQNDGLNKFKFFETTYFPNYENGPYMPTFEWDIDVTDGNNDNTHYKRFGQFVSTPDIEGGWNENCSIKWKVKITDPQKNIVEKSGERNFSTPMYQQAEDSSVAYFDAHITDPDAYQDAVVARVSHTTVSEDEFRDTTFISNLIEKVYVEELTPYLNLEKLSVSEVALQKSPVTKSTKFFPNPTAGEVTIIPGDNFVDGSAISFIIYDLTGKVRLHGSQGYSLGKNISVDINSLPDAIYIIEVKQNNFTERSKIVKVSKGT